MNIAHFCRLFGISRQGYYQKVKRYNEAQMVRRQVIELVKTHRKKHKKKGCVKIHGELQPTLRNLGIKCGRDKFLDFVRDENLFAPHKKQYVKTTQSNHKFKTYPNLIKSLDINRAEQVFVSDITYIRTQTRSMYLFLVTDAYSKRIMGWELADNMKVTTAMKALDMAVSNRIYPDRPLIHHSDRGRQYSNPIYIKGLHDNNIDVSMTTKYDPYENAVAERVNGILKTEYDIGDGFVGPKDARREIEYAIWLYNTDRSHRSCNMLVPVEAHRQENFKLKKWPSKFSLRNRPLDVKHKVFLEQIY